MTNGRLQGRHQRRTLPGVRLVSVNEHPTGTPRKPNGLAPIGQAVWRVISGARK
jgi:hypothetical protein